MSQTTEFILKPTGEVVRRRIAEESLTITEEMVSAMAGNFHRVHRNVFEVPGWGMAHLAINEKQAFITVHLERLVLKCPFKTMNELLVPHFTSTTDPVMALEWHAAEGMRLLLLLEVQVADNRQKYVPNAWLVAADGSNRTFRLPLPNIYDDCRMCLGDNNRYYDSLAKCASGMLEIIAQSSWNADLWKDIGITQRFFQFKPTNSGFDVWEPNFESGWQEGCIKVALNHAKYLVI